MYDHSPNLNGPANNVVRVPALADRVFPFMRYIANDSTLSSRHRAILILRTAWLTQNANLWATHASQATESGLTEEDVLRVAEGPNDGWDEFEASLVGLVDELFRNSSMAENSSLMSLIATTLRKSPIPRWRAS